MYHHLVPLIISMFHSIIFVVHSFEAAHTGLLSNSPRSVRFIHTVMTRCIHYPLTEDFIYYI